MVMKVIFVQVLVTLVVILLSLNFAFAACDAYYQTYRYKSAVFYVSNAAKIKVTVTNAMGDLYPRCFTAWIKVNGNYVNLDGLPYSPSNWQEAWMNEAPNCFNSGYRVACLYLWCLEYDLLNFNNNTPYTGIVEVRVSSDCYGNPLSCYCWDANIELLPSFTTTTTIPNNQLDGWYDTGNTRCNLDGNICGYGIKEKEQEYRDYTCFGATCVYTVTARRWIAIGSCYVSCPTTTTTLACLRSNPTLLISPLTQYGNPGQTLTYYVTVINNDNYICGVSPFTIHVINCPSGFSCNLASASLLISPGNANSTTINVTSSPLSSAGTYQFTLKVENSLSTSYFSSYSANYVISSIFNCNSLDGWYTVSDRCNIGIYECGSGTRERIEEFRDYYPIVVNPSSPSDCSFTVTSTRTINIGTCYSSCPSGYFCDAGFCKIISSNCQVRMYVKDSSNNLPIVNARVCEGAICYNTDNNGLASFYISQGFHNLQVSKEGYYNYSINLFCEDGAVIERNVFLIKQVSCFQCDQLDGWYYTTESYCEIGKFECGSGLRLRKEEYRDYKSVCVSSSSSCKDYNVISYRWVEDGYCYKNCTYGVCEEGLCKQSKIPQPIYIKLEEYDHYRSGGINLGVTFLIISLFVLLLILSRKMDNFKPIK
jgi:hypothetical protein